MKECQNIEWKESWNDEYLKWICAFANTDGGSLCIGINDRGEISPLKNEKKLLEDLPNKIRDILGIIADIQLITTAKGNYIRIEVPPYPNLISYRGRFYCRSGSTTQELRGVDLQRMILKKQGVTWDSIIEPKASLDDLSEEAFLVFKDEISKKGRMATVQNESNVSILEKLGLVENGNLNRAGILLFHKNPERFIFGSYTKIGFFKNDADLLYQNEVHGPLFLQAKQVFDLLVTKYMKAYVSYEGITRVEKFLFDPEAIREAFLNSLIHKDYSSMIPIQIKVYDEKIFFFNSGVLPDNWTTERLFQIHSSKAFNPLIADAFFKTGAIEAWGRGISKIIEACQRDGVKGPCYEITAGSGFSLLLDASERFKALTKRITADYPQGVKRGVKRGVKQGVKIYSEKQKLILSAIRKNPSISFAKIAVATGLTIKVVEKNIGMLKSQGILDRIGTPRGGHWVILKP